MKGPRAALALLSLALPRRRAERPSKSRRLTSLPRVAPTIRPSGETTSATSGSGLFQVESDRMPISARWPTAAIGGALVKTSASGPMPTSRYCDHIFFSTRSAFSAIAASEPGFSLARSSPIAACISARIAAAFSGAPRACSSMTRSSIDTAKVTPAAFTAWRSVGAISQGLPGLRASRGVLARMSARRPTGSPAASRASAAGSAAAARSLMVGAAALTSMSSAPRRTTTAGPSRSGRQARPTSTARSWSSGRAKAGRVSSGIGGLRSGLVPRAAADRGRRRGVAANRRSRKGRIRRGRRPGGAAAAGSWRGRRGY